MLRAAKPHIPRAASSQLRPAARSAAPLQLPGSRRGRWGRRRQGGAQGGGPERWGEDDASASFPDAFAASQNARARAWEEGAKEGGRGKGRGGRPLRAVGWTALLHTVRTAACRAAAAQPDPSRPPLAAFGGTALLTTAHRARAPRAGALLRRRK